MKKQFILPQNIFSKILLSELNLDDDYEIQFLPSALISKNISEDPNSIGLIPALDILTFKDLFVSSQIGISFNGLISNSYLHFKEGQQSIEELFLKGDVSSNEIILSKIIFKELYDVEISPALVATKPTEADDNIIIIGDENYQKGLYLNGLSFTEEIIDLIDAPYINFILAASSENVLKDFAIKHKDSLLNGHTENYSAMFPELSSSVIDFISSNIQHIVFDFEDQDLEAIKSLLQMPYLHGFIKDIIDVKFV